MESKIIYAKTKAAFQRELPNIPVNLNPLVIIEDTREIWILGKYFSIGSPGVYVTEENNIINVEIGQSNFTMSSSGDNIVIRKGDDNNIIFSINQNRIHKTKLSKAWLDFFYLLFAMGSWIICIWYKFWDFNLL